jgi:GrpB-like predicted nucleotidyltransferase (UPF0157 family)
MAGVTDQDSSRQCIDLLATLSYCYAPYRADTMHWFCKPSRHHRTHHLHLVPTGSDRFRGALAFRDHLRRRSGDAARYESLKQALAAQHPNDREAYTQGKTDLIAELTRAALRSTGPSG